MEKVGKASHFFSTRNINNPICNPYYPGTKFLKFPSRTDSTIKASSKKNGLSGLTTRKSPKGQRRLISISTSDGSRWNGKWTSDYIFTLKELQLADLSEDGRKETEVSVSLYVEKHASFGFSVNGRIITSFVRKCMNCSSPFCRKVIYVKPGCEADLDSLVQDTIRLNTSVKETCSETCEKSESRWQSTSGKDSSIDGRWSRLLELKNVI